MSDSQGVIQTKKNAANGTVAFDAITYDAKGTYTYTVEETEKTDTTNYEYSDEVYTIVVVVTENKGKLEAATTITNSAGATVTAMNFENTKKTVVTTGTLKITKTIKGTVTPEEADGLLKFTVTGPEYPNGQEFTIGQGGFDYDDTTKIYTLTLDGIKTGAYEVEETTKDIAGNDVTVKYTVDGTTTESEKASGLSVTAGNTTQVDFEDDYSVITIEPCDITFTASKTLNGGTLQADQFTFTLSDDNNVTLQTKHNDANGTVAFEKITYDAEGTYTYKVEETDKTDSDYTYSDEVYTVVVVVTENNRKLEAATTITNKAGDTVTAMTFENTKNTAPEKGKIIITKKDSTDNTVVLSGAKFVLYDSETGGNIVGTEQTTDDTYGKAEFGDLTIGNTYYIEETQAPTDYEALTGRIKVEINSSAAVLLDVENTPSAPAPTPTGSLIIKKNVTVDGAATTGSEADGTYTFTIKDSSDATEATATITITDGQSSEIQVDNLPVGDYTVVEETPTNGTSLTSGNNIAITVEDSTLGNPLPVAEFTNNKNIVNGSLTITKAVICNGGDPADKDTKTFNVTVTLNDTTVNGEFDGVTFTDGVATFEVTNGSSITITGLPNGTEYSVAEDDASGAFDGYDYSANSQTTGAGTISDTAASEVNLVNEYDIQQAPGPVYGIINVTKNVSNPDGVEGVAGKVFYIAIKDGDDYLQDQNTGTFAATEKYFEILDTETKTFENLTAGKSYKVVENTEDAKVANSELTVTGSGVNVEATPVGTDHTITNTYRKLCKIEISKVKMYGTTGIIGAKLELLRVVGTTETEVETWTSTDKETKKFYLDDGSYIIRELEAPKGYEKSLEDIRFSIVDGTLTADNFDGGKTGKYNANTGLIEFKNDPVTVTGRLSIHVSEEDTGADVPGAEIEVTGPENWPGTNSRTKKFTTNENGNIVDENGNEVLTVTPGDYTYKVTKVPDGFKVTVGQTDTVKVPANKEGHGEAKILPKSGLKITVVDEVTNKPVPGAEVEVKKPDGSTEILKTDENGEITKFVDDTPVGDYTIIVKKVPEGYTVTVNKEQPAKVTRGNLTSVISKINTETGGLLITVLDEKTDKPVPGAEVEVKKPDGSTEILVTDENGQITKFTEKDKDGHYKAPIGEYKIIVVKVPEGYSVTTGKTETKVIEVGKVVEHVAKIGKPEEKPENPGDDVPAQENTTPSTNQQTSNGQVISLSTGTVTDSMTAARTGESKVPYFVFGGSMASLLAGAIIYVVLTKKKKEEEESKPLSLK